MVQLLELTKTLSSFQALLQEHVPSELQAVPHFACRKPVGGHTLQALALRMMRKLVDPDGVTCRMYVSFGLYCLSTWPEWSQVSGASAAVLRIPPKVWLRCTFTQLPWFLPVVLWCRSPVVIIKMMAKGVFWIIVTMLIPDQNGAQQVWEPGPGRPSTPG